MNNLSVKTQHVIEQFQQYDPDFSTRFSPDAWKQIAVFRDHPEFLDGVILYERLFSDNYFSNPVLTMKMREAWRFQIFVMALYLHDSFDPKVARSGLTMANLQNLCVSQKLASAGRIADTLNILTHSGYFTRIQSRKDKRIVHYKAAPVTVEILNKWDKAVFQVIDRIVPGAGLSDSYAANPEFGNKVRMEIAKTRLRNRNTIDRLPEIEFFYGKAGGWSLLTRCIALSLQQPTSTPPALKLDLTELSAEFAASKSSLRRLLIAAHKESFLKEPPVDGRNVTVTNKVLSTFFVWFAMFFGGHYYTAKTIQSAKG